MSSSVIDMVYVHGLLVMISLLFVFSGVGYSVISGNSGQANFLVILSEWPKLVSFKRFGWYWPSVKVIYVVSVFFYPPPPRVHTHTHTYTHAPPGYTCFFYNKFVYKNLEAQIWCNIMWKKVKNIN